MTAEDIIEATQNAIAEYVKTQATPQSIRADVFKTLDKQRRLVILAMLGMKQDRYGSDSFTIDKQSMVGALISEHAKTEVDVYLAEAVRKMDLTPTPKELSAMTRNAKETYNRALREAVHGQMESRAAGDAARIVAAIGDDIDVVEKMAAEVRTNPPESQKYPELDNTFRMQAILAEATVLNMVAILEDGSISEYADDPNQLDVRFLVSIKDKILERTATVVVDGDKWQPAHITRNTENEIDPSQSHLLEAFTHQSHAIFTLMGSADRDVIAAAITEYTAGQAGEAKE